MGEDPLNKCFGEDWAPFMRDLLFSSGGSPKFKSNLWNDIRKVILQVPTLIKQYINDSLDFVVENLTLQGRNLFPNTVQFGAHSFHQVLAP
ncbi:hypothetical protein GALMADRAFT_459480 [Galerina marginata CBS 339.88]|uniref:HAM1-like N-terminal domain-containing protein n=1 Tax=Galerina marginata (strain CBS 339.88) TaxID=685588 RepID=A0A067SYT7_GALM3|nr:hypothetical protein GALMADRAFT_459480 [Galerina marginata CBS 339.88]